MPIIPLTWDVYVGSDRKKGDLSHEGSIVSDWVHVSAKPFSVEIENTAAGSPEGTWKFQVCNDRARTPKDIDTDDWPEQPTHPDATALAQFQLVTLPAIHCWWFRLKYTRSGGGAADYVQATVAVQP